MSEIQYVCIVAGGTEDIAARDIVSKGLARDVRIPETQSKDFPPGLITFSSTADPSFIASDIRSVRAVLISLSSMQLTDDENIASTLQVLNYFLVLLLLLMMLNVFEIVSQGSYDAMCLFVCLLPFSQIIFCNRTLQPGVWQSLTGRRSLEFGARYALPHD